MRGTHALFMFDDFFGVSAQVWVSLDQLRQVFRSLFEGGVGCVVDCVRGVGVRGVVDPPSQRSRLEELGPQSHPVWACWLNNGGRPKSWCYDGGVQGLCDDGRSQSQVVRACWLNNGGSPQNWRYDGRSQSRCHDGGVQSWCWEAWLIVAVGLVSRLYDYVQWYLIILDDNG